MLGAVKDGSDGFIFAFYSSVFANSPITRLVWAGSAELCSESKALRHLTIRTRRRLEAADCLDATLSVKY